MLALTAKGCPSAAMSMDVGANPVRIRTVSISTRAETGSYTSRSYMNRLIWKNGLRRLRTDSMCLSYRPGTSLVPSCLRVTHCHPELGSGSYFWRVLILRSWNEMTSGQTSCALHAFGPRMTNRPKRTEPSPSHSHPYLAQYLYERFVYEAPDLARHAARITTQKSKHQKTFRAEVFEN